MIKKSMFNEHKKSIALQPANPSSAPIGDSEGMNTHTPSTWSVQNTKETNLEIETYYNVPKLKKEYSEQNM